jgi:thiol:disulfide interchange protein DsbD
MALGALSATTAQTPGLPELTPTMPSKSTNIADEAEKAVGVRLISESSALVPGGSVTIGVTFDIAKGWNLYWRNAGDSGLPITVKFETPEGVTIGEPQWPTPERHVLPGDLLDYVYTRRVTLLFPITASPSLAPTSNGVPTSITIKAEAKWLVCKEACVPGERTIELTLPIATDAKPSTDAPLFAAARDRLPRTQAEQSSPIVSASWDKRTLRLASTGADELTFFPYEGESQPEDSLTQGDANRDALALSYAKAETGARIAGVLVVRRLGRTTYHVVEPPPLPASE